MGLELYEGEPVFRAQVDLCAEALKPRLGVDLREVLYPSAGQAGELAPQLNQTFITQPALFTIEYALAKLWMEWVGEPQAMIGHSLGEYVAACLAGVFSLEDALGLVAARGQLMQDLPRGAMLSVRLPAEQLQHLLGEKLSIAAINGQCSQVVSGPPEMVEELEHRLAAESVNCRRLQTSHAFHSEMMEPVLKPFNEQVSRVVLRPPSLPFISNVTGTWITPAEATDPSYWTAHLRHTVLFADGLTNLLSGEKWMLLEVGPGQALGAMVAQHPGGRDEQVTLCSLPHPPAQQSEVACLLTTLSRLWLSGVSVNWPRVYAHQRRRRVHLPSYPFERKRYWLEPPLVSKRETRRQHIATQSSSEAETVAVGTGLEQVIEHQLHVISQQLSLLGNGHPTDRVASPHAELYPAEAP
jgi:acyl transferase domain-containing protein